MRGSDERFGSEGQVNGSDDRVKRDGRVRGLGEGWLSGVGEWRGIKTA